MRAKSGGERTRELNREPKWDRETDREPNRCELAMNVALWRLATILRRWSGIDGLPLMASTIAVHFLESTTDRNHNIYKFYCKFFSTFIWIIESYGLFLTVYAIESNSLRNSTKSALKESNTSTIHALSYVRPRNISNRNIICFQCPQNDIL